MFSIFEMSFQYYFSAAPSRSESEPDIPLVEPELVTMPEAGFPRKPQKEEEERHKVEVEMNVEARKEVSVVEGKFLGSESLPNSQILFDRSILWILWSAWFVQWMQYIYLMVFFCIPLL